MLLSEFQRPSSYKVKQEYSDIILKQKSKSRFPIYQIMSQIINRRKEMDFIRLLHCNSVTIMKEEKPVEEKFLKELQRIPQEKDGKKYTEKKQETLKQSITQNCFRTQNDHLEPRLLHHLFLEKNNPLNLLSNHKIIKALARSSSQLAFTC